MHVLLARSEITTWQLRTGITKGNITGVGQLICRKFLGKYISHFWAWMISTLSQMFKKKKKNLAQTKNIFCLLLCFYIRGFLLKNLFAVWKNDWQLDWLSQRLKKNSFLIQIIFLILTLSILSTLTYPAPTPTTHKALKFYHFLSFQLYFKMCSDFGNGLPGWNLAWGYSFSSPASSDSV